MRQDRYKITFYLPTLGFASVGSYPTHRAARDALLYKRGPALKARYGIDGCFVTTVRGVR